MPTCRWLRSTACTEPGLGHRAATEDGKNCKDILGQDVGVNSVGGARSVALRSMLTGCPGVKLEDTKQIALGSNRGSGAMIAGRLKYAVLHLDDLAEIETQGKKLYILLAMKNTDPNSHYLTLVVRKDNLAKNRDGDRAHGRRHDRGRALHAGPEERRCSRQEAALVTGHTKEGEQGRASRNSSPPISGRRRTMA